jgi:WD40 repeat protein
LAGGSEDGDVRLWDLNTRLPIAKFTTTGGMYSMAFSSDWSTLASGTPESGIDLWNSI